MNYKKENPRLLVKYVDSDTDEILFEIKNRTWMDVGQLLNDGSIDNVVKNELKGRKYLPKNVMVLVIADASLNE